MRCRKARGDGTVAEAGTDDTHGDRKRGSVVARAISSTEPGSGTSPATARVAQKPGNDSSSNPTTVERTRSMFILPRATTPAVPAAVYTRGA